MGCWDKRLFKWVIMKNNWFRVCVVDVTSCAVSVVIVAFSNPNTIDLISAIFNFFQSIFNVYYLFVAVHILALRYILRCCKSAQEQVLDDASERIEELVKECGGDSALKSKESSQGPAAQSMPGVLTDNGSYGLVINTNSTPIAYTGAMQMVVVHGAPQAYSTTTPAAFKYVQR